VNDVDGVGEPKLQKQNWKIESQVEDKNLKGDLSVRSIYPQLEQLLDVISPHRGPGTDLPPLYAT
jgi:hypothetical protein